MTRVMRDSTVINDIPIKGTDIVATYRNGRYAHTQQQVKARFPRTPILWIDVNATAPSSAHALDIETGDATPDHAPGWIKERWATVHPMWSPPLLYCNRGNRAAVQNACKSAGLTVGNDYLLWVATLDGTKTLPDMTGVAAVQAYGSKQTGGNYDESLVYDASLLSSRRGVIVRGLTSRVVRSGNAGHEWR